ncbi:MAG TPA: molybdate ABC transporter substrate-binding protein [Steroidobacteraceae bacterium]|jgi:molybdate transport system substrate-binding protein
MLLGALSPHAAETSQQPLLVFGASSLTNVLDEIGAAYTRETGQPVKFSYAASSVLAKQVEAGARADVFFSADTDWMDYLQQRNLIDKSTRKELLGNRLVLVAPADSQIQLKIAPNFPLAAALGKGRLATGDPDSVPVGKYARTALTSLGVWNDVADKLVRAENVRSALAFIARGEAPLGIVYETDAKVDKNVRVVDAFPASSHLPITYPVATTAVAQPAAAAFVTYLRGETAAAAFRKYGFTVLP